MDYGHSQPTKQEVSKLNQDDTDDKDVQNCCPLSFSSLTLSASLAAVVIVVVILGLYAPQVSFQKLSNYTRARCIQETRSCLILSSTGTRTAYMACQTSSLGNTRSVSHVSYTLLNIITTRVSKYSSTI